jgi:hypothetical protein
MWVERHQERLRREAQQLHRLRDALKPPQP